MADDHDDEKDESIPDPWAGIEADEAEEAASEISLSFESALDDLDVDEAFADAVPELAADEPAAQGSATHDPLAISTPSDEAPAIPSDEVSLGVFPPADPPAPAGADVEAGGEDEVSSSIQSSAIQIGTGQSGIISMDEWAEAASGALTDGSGPVAEGAAGSAGMAIEEDPFAGIGAGIGDEQAESADGTIGDAVQAFDGSFADPGDADEGDEPAVETASEILPMAAAAAAHAVGATAHAVGATAKPKKARQGGIGQMIGVVLGGLMALPITYAILVWGFQKDPFKLTKMLPSQVSFLLPAKFQPGYRRPAGPTNNFSGPSPLDSLASLPVVPPTDGPAATEDQPVAKEEEMPMPAADGDAAADDAAASEGLNADAVIADALHADAGPRSGDAAAPAAGDELAAVDPAAEASPAAVPAAAPPPEPLDLTGLETAVEKANSALDSLVAVVDPEDPVRRKRLVGWYKNLAKVGEELTQLERVASDTGRPLEQPPAPLAALQGRIAGSGELVDELDKLGKMWLTSQKRPADGVVLLATFGSSRKVGPYWSSRVSLVDAAGGTHDMAVISRIEPAAAEGDRVLLTGVLFDGEVIWAADCRSLQAAKQAASQDLF